MYRNNYGISGDISLIHYNKHKILKKRVNYIKATK